MLVNSHCELDLMCTSKNECKSKKSSLFLIFVKKQSQELTRVNPDRNMFSINVELTSTFLLYRGLVHHHHEILKQKLAWFIGYVALCA